MSLLCCDFHDVPLIAPAELSPDPEGQILLHWLHHISRSSTEGKHDVSRGVLDRLLSIANKSNGTNEIPAPYVEYSLQEL